MVIAPSGKDGAGTNTRQWPGTALGSMRGVVLDAPALAGMLLMERSLSTLGRSRLHITAWDETCMLACSTSGLTLVCS